MVDKTILEDKSLIKIGGRGFRVSPFSLGTLIKVSGCISRLPNIDSIALDSEENVLEAIKTSLMIGKECEGVADILAYFIMGTKRHYDIFYRIRFYFLKRWILNLPINEVYNAIAWFINNSNLSSFFVNTTFLTGINLLKPTKVD